MRVAVYARYSSENQRKESIEDQTEACRRAAKAHGWVVLEAHVYADFAYSGASLQRPALTDLLAAAKGRLFDVLFVDDLSRLARDTTHMLVTLGNLKFDGVRVISVADHLDTDDEESTFAIQMRGVFNEIQLSDLRKKTLRGQEGQKARGYDVGERTYGYCSKAHGAVRIDKRGQPRPEGYKKEILPSQAAVVRRIFDEYAAGVAISGIVAGLNEEGVPPPQSRSSGWGPGTVYRLLRNTKYVGVWVWNRTGSRREPSTGRRTRYEKPEDQHDKKFDQTLRIIPQPLWDSVQQRKQAVSKVWPSGKRRGFSSGQRSRSEVFPTYLFNGMLCCAGCKLAIVLVGGKSGGYYGCAGAARRVCDNHLTVSRSKLERIFLSALRSRLSDPAVIRYAFQRVSDEIAKLHGDVGDLRSRKQAELAAAGKELNNLVDFVRRGEGPDSAAVAAAIAAVEPRVSRLKVEVEALRHGDGPAFPVPSEEWIAARVARLQELLERRTSQSALVLRRLLGKVDLDPVHPEKGRAYYVARTAIDTFALLDPPGPDGGPDGGSGSLRWWRRRESNPRPKIQHRRNLHAYPPLIVSLPAWKGGGNRRKPSPD